MEAPIEQSNRDFARGIYYLLQEELQKSPPSDWELTIERLQKHFGYQISLRDYHKVTFTEKQKSQILAGEIVVIDFGKMLWKRVGDGDMILGMGPFPEVKRTVPVEIFVWGSFILLAGSVMLVWAYLFWRKLMVVNAATAEFGNGNFDIRMKISSRSAVAQLAATFNSMADRIQGLIQSHKELTNAVSHELRTPLARIRFGLEMLRSSFSKRDREFYSDGIQRDVNELDELVSELLMYAKFDRETMSMHQVKCAIVPWMEELVSTSKNHSVEVNFECLLANRDLVASLDPKQMGRAIDNLLQNASRYGNGVVSLTLDVNGKVISIHVDDNGPGIPESDRKRIFDPFTRLDTSRSRESGGVGLGLAIVSRIIECHGGKVSVSDSDLGGCRFTISLACVN